MNYVQGTAGVSAPQRQAPMGARSRAAPRREHGGGGRVRARSALGSTVRGLPLAETALWPHHRDRSDKGEFRWQIAHGETPDNVRNNPAAEGSEYSAHRTPGTARRADHQDSGDLRRGRLFTNPAGVRGAMLRAYDKATGKEVGAVYMPAPQSGSPMTYMLNGQQYIVFAVGGTGVPGELIAFKLASD